jgi:hypothetical protein
MGTLGRAAAEMQMKKLTYIGKLKFTTTLLLFKKKMRRPLGHWFRNVLR